MNPEQVRERIKELERIALNNRVKNMSLFIERLININKELLKKLERAHNS